MLFFEFIPYSVGFCLFSYRSMLWSCLLTICTFKSRFSAWSACLNQFDCLVSCWLQPSGSAQASVHLYSMELQQQRELHLTWSTDRWRWQTQASTNVLILRKTRISLNSDSAVFLGFKSLPYKSVFTFLPQESRF